MFDCTMFLIIGEFGHERNYFQISSNTEREAYISFLSSCFPDFYCIRILQTIFFCIHFTWIYLPSHLQSFRGTSRHPPVAFFWFSVFSTQRLESRGISGYEQFPTKLLFLSHENSKRRPKLPSLPSMLLCSLKEKSISSAPNW